MYWDTLDDSDTRLRVKSMAIPETVCLVRYGAFALLPSLRFMRFKGVNVAFEGAVFKWLESLETILVKVKNKEELEEFKLRLRWAGLPENVLVFPY